MRELIALRAKIDLLQKDCEGEMSRCDDIIDWMYLEGKCSTYEDIRDMIDETVSKEMDKMLEEHERRLSSKNE